MRGPLTAKVPSPPAYWTESIKSRSLTMTSALPSWRMTMRVENFLYNTSSSLKINTSVIRRCYDVIIQSAAWTKNDRSLKVIKGYAIGAGGLFGSFRSDRDIFFFWKFLFLFFHANRYNVEKLYFEVNSFSFKPKLSRRANKCTVHALLFGRQFSSSMHFIC